MASRTSKASRGRWAAFPAALILSFARVETIFHFDALHLDTSNDVADRDMRWYLDEHVDMLFGQNARDDLYPQFLQTCRMMVRIRSRNVPSRTL
jgi:hypothetical protein